MKKLALFTLLPLLALTSCSVNKQKTWQQSLVEYRAYDLPATLPSNPNAVKVKVSLSQQVVYVMEGNTPLLVMPVSVGKPAKPTPNGNFRIYSKQQHRRANTHGYAYKGSRTNPIGAHKVLTKYMPGGHKFLGTPMPYWCEFKSSYGFHTGWLKPYPCSSGCIRMHENLAPKFFRLVKSGTPVNISHTQAEDATLGASVKRPPNADPFPGYDAPLRMSNRIFSNHKSPKYVNGQ